MKKTYINREPDDSFAEGYSFIFFDKHWKEELPGDKTGDFDMIYEFLEKNWTILKWVALGIVILQALIFLLALMVRAANRPADYDSDDEFIVPRPQIRQPLINRPPAPAAGIPVPTLEQRPSRNDAWSTRMREKVFSVQSIPLICRHMVALYDNVRLRQVLKSYLDILETSEY
ncbi:hypothetical protein V6N12_009619 [Hibiscus sabdariffa]|uniref:Uncharacterized protein n=1 Tax=Hibiscus sabdariffa TaxID=183260 RepID=A0ABR2BUT1_9ROSI